MTMLRAKYPLLCALGLAAVGCSTAPPASSSPTEGGTPRSEIQSDDLKIEDHPVALPIQARLRGPSDGTQQEALELELTNMSLEDREVWVELSAGGLANSESTRSYDAVGLAAGETTVVRIAASELPIQTSLLPVSTVITVGYSQGDFAPGRVVVGDLWMTFNADLTKFALSPSGTPYEHTLGEGVEKGAVGRIYDRESGEFVALDGAALTINEGAQVIGFEANPDDIDELPDGASIEQVPETSSNKAAFSRFCVRFRYGFADSGYGEDRLTAVPTGTMAAAFVRVNVLRGPTRIFQGFLNSSGCTPTMKTEAGRYTVKVFSRVGREGKELWAYDNRDDGSLGSWSALVDVTAGTEPTLPVFPSVASDYAAFLAFSSTALSAFPEAIFGTTRMYINEGCGSVSAACVGLDPNVPGRRAVFLGSDDNGNRLVRQKFVVGHELGHVIQHLNFGLLANTPYSGFETGPHCNCDHVEGVNQIHCMQSRESAGMAQVEGFAHYAAARILNVHSRNSDCSFAYYKQFRTLDGVVHPAPYAVPCHWTYSFNQICGPDPNSPNTGTELDWMSFYWRATTLSSSFDFSDLRLLYIKACDPACSGGPSCFDACAGDRINAWMLEQAAGNTWGFGSEQHRHLGTLLHATL